MCVSGVEGNFDYILYMSTNNKSEMHPLISWHGYIETMGIEMPKYQSLKEYNYLTSLPHINNYKSIFKRYSLN